MAEPAASPGWSVTVLGVAQDGGLPHPGCECPRCSAARDGRRRREKVACLGLTDGRRAFLVDATPDLAEQMHALGAAIASAKASAGDPSAPRVRTPDGVLLTHAHMGHYVGLAWLGKEALGARGFTIHGTPRMGDFLATNAPWRALFDEGRATFDARSPVDLGGVVAEAIPVPHRQEFTDAVAWRIRGPRGSVLWLPDIDSWDAWDLDVRDVVASVDVAFLDATFYADGELGHRDRREIPHPRVVETMRRLAGLGDRVRLIHLNHTNPLWDDPSPAAALGFRVAREGETFPI
ncbi:MAG: pyrroloquinoline quinone biosynthesis protein PqqB [Planctomycetes bacterium]|nr:pyrroloquinoline quinone biosynthesis protein PqqB [Planctomycetota bacterium]